MFPVIGRNLLESINLLSNVTRVLVDKCIGGIIANVDRLRAYAESSPSIVTPLNKYVGYEEAAKIAKQALREGKTIKTVVLERGHVANGTLTAEQLDSLLDVLSMTHP
jgi:fumarate hydratase class II